MSILPGTTTTAPALNAEAVPSDEYTRCTRGGAFYLRHADGRRTRLYIDLEACWKAAGRGELYTEAEYQRLTTPRRRGR